MIVQIRRVRARSVFLVGLALYGTVGLLVGIFLAVISTLQLPAGTQLNALNRLGGWSILVFPVVYGIAGGLSAGIGAALYNAAAAVVGGIKVEIPDIEPQLRESREPE